MTQSDTANIQVRLASPTPCACRPVSTEQASATGLTWEVCIEFCPLHAHARNDLTALCALVQQQQRILTLAKEYVGTYAGAPDDELSQLQIELRDALAALPKEGT